MKKPENWEKMSANEQRAWQILHDSNFWDGDGCVEPGSEEEKKLDAEAKKFWSEKDQK